MYRFISFSKTCWSYPLKTSVLNVGVGGLSIHVSTYPFSYSQRGLTRKVIIMELPSNSMSIPYSTVLGERLELSRTTVHLGLNQTCLPIPPPEH